jgi:hypothetical protein
MQAGAMRHVPPRHAAPGVHWAFEAHVVSSALVAQKPPTQNWPPPQSADVLQLGFVALVQRPTLPGRVRRKRLRVGLVGRLV